MQTEEWELIRRNLIFMRERLNIDVVTLYLYQEHEINDNEEEALAAIPDKKDRSVGLLRLLRTKPGGYIALLNALKQVQPDIATCLLPTSRGGDGSTYNANDAPNPPPPPYTSRYYKPQSSVQPPSYEQSVFIPGSPSYRKTENTRPNLPSNLVTPSANTSSHQSLVSCTIPSRETALRSGNNRLTHSTESCQSPINLTVPSNASALISDSFSSRHDSYLENHNLPCAHPTEDSMPSSATHAYNSGSSAAPHKGLQSSDDDFGHAQPTEVEMSAGPLPQLWKDQETIENFNSKVNPVDQASRTPFGNEMGSLNTSHNSLISDQHLDDDESQTQMRFEEITVLVKDLYTNNLTCRRDSCRHLLLNSTNNMEKRGIVKAGGIGACLDIIKMEKDEPLLEYATGVLWNLSANAEYMDTLMYEGLTILVKNAIVPFETFSRNRFIFRNAVGIIRNISTASLNDDQNGWKIRNKLREHEGLAKSIVQFLRTSVNNSDLETKAVENAVFVVRNLSHRIQEIFDKDYDMLPQEEEEEEKEELKGIAKVFAHLFMAKSKETKEELTPFISETVSRHCQDLVDRSVLSIYMKILFDCAKTVIVCATLKTLTGLMQCNWCYAVELREYFRKDKGLPLTVELLIQEESRIVDHVAELLQYLTIDSTNGKLIGKFGMKQLIGILPQSVSHKKYSDPTIIHILSTFGNIFRQNPNEGLERLFVQEGGANSLKFIKFVDGVYLQSTKQEAQKVLELLWKVSSLQSVYIVHGLRKLDVTADIVI